MSNPVPRLSSLSSRGLCFPLLSFCLCLWCHIIFRFSRTKIIDSIDQISPSRLQSNDHILRSASRLSPPSLLLMITSISLPSDKMYSALYYFDNNSSTVITAEPVQSLPQSHKILRTQKGRDCTEIDRWMNERIDWALWIELLFSQLINTISCVRDLSILFNLISSCFFFYFLSSLLVILQPCSFVVHSLSLFPLLPPLPFSTPVICPVRVIPLLSFPFHSISLPASDSFWYVLLEFSIKIMKSSTIFARASFGIYRWNASL